MSTNHDNTRTGERIITGDMDRELLFLQKLPVRLRAWCEEHAPISLCVELVYQFYVKVGEEEALRMLRWEQVKDTAGFYGEGHPFVQSVMTEITKVRGIRK